MTERSLGLLGRPHNFCLWHAEIDDKIVRYELKNGETAPMGKPETIVRGIPITGDHPMRP